MTTERELHEQNLALHKINKKMATELAQSLERLSDRLIAVINQQNEDIKHLKFRVEYLEKKERLRRESEKLKVVH